MEKTGMIFSAINTILIVTGGILGYLLIETEYLNESKANTSLASSEMEINHAELGVLISEKVLKNVKAEFATISQALEVAKTNGEVIRNLSQTKLN